MFGFSRHASSDESPSPNSSSIVTIVGAGTTTRGSLKLGTEDLRIEGTVIGEVRTEGRMCVGSGGVVRGDVRAESIRVEGTAKGVLLAQECLVALSSAVVHGILCAEEVTLENGAELEGGICHNVARLPALVAALSAADEHPFSDPLSSIGEWGASFPDRSSKTSEKPATLAVSEGVSPPENELLPTQRGDSVPEARSREPQSEEPESGDADTEEEDNSLTSTLGW